MRHRGCVCPRGCVNPGKAPPCAGYVIHTGLPVISSPTIVIVYFTAKPIFFPLSLSRPSLPSSLLVSSYLSRVTRGDVNADDIPAGGMTALSLDSHGALVSLPYRRSHRRRRRGL